MFKSKANLLGFITGIVGTIIIITCIKGCAGAEHKHQVVDIPSVIMVPGRIMKVTTTYVTKSGETYDMNTFVDPDRQPAE